MSPLRPGEPTIGLADASKQFNIHLNTLAGWVSCGKVAAQHIPGHGRAGRVLIASLTDITLLAASHRVQVKKKKKRAVSLAVCASHLEPDAIDSANQCDAVAGTMAHDGLVFTSADYVELARRRTMFETRRAA